MGLSIPFFCDRGFYGVQNFLCTQEKVFTLNLNERKYFVGNYFNIADVSVYSCLEYLDLRFSKLKWRDKYPNLKTYWSIHKDRPSFKI